MVRACGICLLMTTVSYSSFRLTSLYDRERGLRVEPLHGYGVWLWKSDRRTSRRRQTRYDDEEVAEATLQLRRELLELDVEAVEIPRAGDPPPGSRAVDLAAIGALVVTVAQSQLLASVVAAVQSWLAGSRRRSIKLGFGGDVLELEGVSSDEQRRLTDEWLRRHESR